MLLKAATINLKGTENVKKLNKCPLVMTTLTSASKIFFLVKENDPLDLVVNKCITGGD